MTRFRPLSFALSSARSARARTVSAESPAWNSVTPKLAVTDSPPRLGRGVFSKADSNRLGPLSGRRVVAVGGHEQELFSAVAGDQSSFATVRVQDRCETDQCFVSRRMAVDIVDPFEMIDVADDQAETVAPGRRLRRSTRWSASNRSGLDWRRRSADHALVCWCSDSSCSSRFV